jgi:hypothetical protein
MNNLSNDQPDIALSSMKKERLNSWSTNQENLLKSWADKIAGYRWLHLRSNELYDRYNNYLAYPIMILSTIAGVGGLSSISPDKPTPFELYTQYVFFSCNIVVSILSSIQRFNSYVGKSERHSQAAVQYSKFYRLISMELSLDRSERDFGVEFCKQSKIEFDRLLSASPEIPISIIDMFNSKFSHLHNKPDVCNGLTYLDNYCEKSNSSIVSNKSSIPNCLTPLDNNPEDLHVVTE